MDQQQQQSLLLGGFTVMKHRKNKPEGKLASQSQYRQFLCSLFVQDQDHRRQDQYQDPGCFVIARQSDEHWKLLIC